MAKIKVVNGKIKYLLKVKELNQMSTIGSEVY